MVGKPYFREGSWPGYWSERGNSGGRWLSRCAAELEMPSIQTRSQELKTLRRALESIDVPRLFISSDQSGLSLVNYITSVIYSRKSMLDIASFLVWKFLELGLSIYPHCCSSTSHNQWRKSRCIPKRMLFYQVSLLPLLFMFRSKLINTRQVPHYYLQKSSASCVGFILLLSVDLLLYSPRDSVWQNIVAHLCRDKIIRPAWQHQWKYFSKIPLRLLLFDVEACLRDCTSKCSSIKSAVTLTRRRPISIHLKEQSRKGQKQFGYGYHTDTGWASGWPV